MNALRAIFSYPLLARELTERAARKRTYAVRACYGLVLYTLFVIAVQRLVAQAASDPTGMGGLGFGRELFGTLIGLQCWGVLFLQPALMAGVITYEKERDSLSLLLLTGMRPGKIILEKYLAGLLPMATLLLLALPLGAITMGYGGVSPQLLAAGGGVVLATWLMAGAFALLCSAWCRTTIGAMLASYTGGALVMLAPAIFYSLTFRYVLWGADLSGFTPPEAVWALWPPEIFSRVLAWQEGSEALTAGGAGWGALLAETWQQCRPMLGTAVVCLLLAMLVLGRRALLPVVAHAAPGTAGLALRYPRLFAAGRRLMAWWHRYWPAPPALPGDDPIAWRESGRSGLGGRGQFLYSSFMLAGITVTLSFALLSLYPRTAGPERLHYFGAILGAIAVLVLIVRSAGSLLNEHTNQTLDILLTTPLSAAETLREKVHALTRYRVLFAVLLGIVFTLQGWSENEYVREKQWQQLGQYWLCAGIAVVVYPGLIVWTSTFFALWLRARTKAILAALCLFAVWFVAPMAALNFAMPDWREHRNGLWLSLLSPLGILDANKNSKLPWFSVEVIKSRYTSTGIGQPWVPVAANFGGYLLITYVVRGLTLRLADRWLRR
jgi:ABC-type transport system involved in multi-copper enzyme maturation permease subunit